jgi:hypothetical protein
MPTATAPHPFRQAMEAHDVPTAMACFSPDAVLRSPITSRIKFEGREQLTALFEDVVATLDHYTYLDEWDGGDTRILHVRSAIGREELELVQLLRLDDEGMIREITLLGRPLTAVATLLSRLGPRVAGRRGRLRGALAVVGLRPIVAALHLTDRLSVRLAAPRP